MPDTAIESDEFDSLMKNAAAQFAARKYDTAIAYYNRALALDPGSALALYNRGCVHAMKDDFVKAIADWNAVLRIEPDHAKARRGIPMAYVKRGEAYARVGDVERARVEFEKALNLDPGNEGAANGMKRLPPSGRRETGSAGGAPDYAADTRKERQTDAADAARARTREEESGAANRASPVRAGPVYTMPVSARRETASLVTPERRYGMIEFVRAAFRTLLEIFLWIDLIACGIGGALLGMALIGMAGGHGSGTALGIVGFIVGAIAGAIVGIFLIIACGGFVATILNIDANLERLAGGGSNTRP